MITFIHPFDTLFIKVVAVMLRELLFDKCDHPAPLLGSALNACLRRCPLPPSIPFCVFYSAQFCFRALPWSHAVLRLALPPPRPCRGVSLLYAAPSPFRERGKSLTLETVRNGVRGVIFLTVFETKYSPPNENRPLLAIFSVIVTRRRAPSMMRFCREAVSSPSTGFLFRQP